MNPVRSALLVTAAVLCAACTTHHSVRRVGGAAGGMGEDGGVLYALPLTVATVQVTVRKTVQKQGPLSDFAALNAAQLGFPRRIVTGTKTSYAVTAAKIGTVGRPDPDQLFLATLEDGPFQDAKLEAELERSGVLTSFSSSNEDHAIEFAVNTIKVAADIAGKVIGLGFGEAMAPAEVAGVTSVDVGSARGELAMDMGMGKGATFQARLEAERQVLRRVPWLDLPPEDKRDLVLKQRVVQEFFAWRSSGIGEPPPGVAKKPWNTIKGYDDAWWSGVSSSAAAVTSAQLASSLMESLGQLDSSRNTYLQSTQAAAGQPTMERRLKEFKSLRDQIRAAFVGTTGVTELTLELQVPLSAGISSVKTETTVLFALAPAEGIVRAGLSADSVAVPISVKFRATGIPTKMHRVSLKLRLTCEQEAYRAALAESAPVEDDVCDERGFFYRVPALVRAWVAAGSRTVSVADIQVAQVGVIAWLPRSVWGTDSSYAFELHPGLGALKKAALSTTGLPPNTLTPVGGAAGTVIDAYGEREAARKADRDPTHRTRGAADLLEQQVRQRELELRLQELEAGE